MGAARAAWDAGKHPHGWHGRWATTGGGHRTARAVGRTPGGLSKSDLANVGEQGKRPLRDIAHATTGMHASKREKATRIHVGSVTQWRPGVANGPSGYQNVRSKHKYQTGKWGPWVPVSERGRGGHTIGDRTRHLVKVAGFEQVGYRPLRPGAPDVKVAASESKMPAKARRKARAARMAAPAKPHAARHSA